MQFFQFSEIELSIILILCTIFLLVIYVIIDKITSKISEKKIKIEKEMRKRYFEEMDDAITDYFDRLRR